MRKYNGTYGDVILDCHFASRDGTESADYIETADKIVSKIRNEEDVSSSEIAFLINTRTVNRKTVGYKFSENDNSKGALVISFSKIPKNCGECPMYMYEINQCYFGCGHCGRYLARPCDCPIQVKPDNIS
jgi:hypothetical protein